jgi:hypothetical protein
VARALSSSAVARYASPSNTPDYSKGPSALDKAAQVFFFTEIVRGELVVVVVVVVVLEVGEEEVRLGVGRRKEG